VTRNPIPWRLVVPNLVTGANIAIGFCSILASAHGRYDLAVRLLVAAIFCDMFDGQLARRLRATSKFGQEMDSLSDALSFGAAPAFLVYAALLQELGPWGVAVAVLYLMAGVLRLARFNVTANEHVKDRRTLGVPIPVAAGYAMAVALMRGKLDPWAGAAVIVAMALLMVSRIRLPHLKGNTLVTWMLLVGICNYLAVVARPGWPTVVWWNVWNVAILAAAWATERRERPTGAPAT
jgi:CDP-diacylglycerol--serine O-phosphatidyltransferase